MNPYFSVADLLLMERVRLNGFVASRDKERFARLCDTFRTKVAADNKPPESSPEAARVCECGAAYNHRGDCRRPTENSPTGVSALESALETVAELHGRLELAALENGKLLGLCARALAAWEGTGPAIVLDDLRAAVGAPEAESACVCGPSSLVRARDCPIHGDGCAKESAPPTYDTK